jgi:bisphosphoglycerate-independent phosphoglycerate mutase (AlkP superfamily)
MKEENVKGSAKWIVPSAGIATYMLQSSKGVESVTVAHVELRKFS